MQLKIVPGLRVEWHEFTLSKIHGLVQYTALKHVEHSMDHIGSHKRAYQFTSHGLCMGPTQCEKSACPLLERNTLVGGDLIEGSGRRGRGHVFPHCVLALIKKRMLCVLFCGEGG